MKALVLGVNGFIGGHLADNLVLRGYNVVGVGRSDSVRTHKYSYKNGDLCDPDFVDDIMRDGYDEVYQLAADVGGISYIKSNRDADIMSNSALININVARACVKYKIKKLFFSSSACVYYTRDCREDEAYPAMPDTEYGWEKLFAERLYINYWKQHGLNVRIARFHSIVGEHSVWQGGKEKAHSALARKVAMVENGGTIDVFGDGTQTRTFLHVSECIDGIHALMNTDTTEPINIGSDHLVTINEYIDILRTVSGKQFTIHHILDGTIGAKERSCDLTKARSLINWNPVMTLEESTRRTYTWIVDQIQATVV